MNRTILAGLALGTFLATGAAHAAVTFPATVDRGGSQNIVIDYVDVSAEAGIFTTAKRGTATVEVYGLSDLVQASFAAFGSSFATATGNVNNGGTLGSFKLKDLAAGTYTLDLASSTASAGAGCGTLCQGSYGVRVTLTPVPAAAGLLLPALVGLGWLRRRAKKTA